ncbi:transporter [Butyricimonas faecalis]|uniref:Transporter n=2 Tax=Butyricimonas faecalis TaxID=2093856 RepID=A0A3Q9ISG9_9BACT|nr:transporter [Butyricimonas faecalis]
MAIILGLLLHSWCSLLAWIVPYFIFIILLLNFVAVDLRKLHISSMNLWLMLFQIVVSIGGYYTIRSVYPNETVAQGILIGILCPVAASVVVIASMLGAKRETTTTYTIVGNLMVAIIAPVYFSFIGSHQDMSFINSFLLILSKISPVIALPFFVVLVLQVFFPKTNHFLSRYKGISFYLWAICLLLTLGQTINFIFIHGKGNENTILALGISSVITCTIHFATGKWLGGKYGDRIAGGQLLGQKNTAMGIWMANTYLNPLASVFLAFYSIWQNLFNSWQLWYQDRKNEGTSVKAHPFFGHNFCD